MSLGFVLICLGFSFCLFGVWLVRVWDFFVWFEVCFVRVGMRFLFRIWGFIIFEVLGRFEAACFV